jgi:addiction module HigA family antidote
MHKLEPMHPGKILLEDFIKKNNISVNRLSNDINQPCDLINQVIDGKSYMPLRMMISLGEHFLTGTIFWLDLQKNYKRKKLNKENEIKC